ncbi:DUF4367 domain-containing protein [Intestinimonas butyriciproducens]|uniref:DUF4367 domain-containing protein n=1 Tax=Intestinimonas butyriciproducens TaxID=1297617 RepID=UPI00242FC5C8|nr:DUF4367 domain-containing protein [Intestinimonas butyriciproducens]
MNQIDEMIRESILDDDDALLKAVEQAEHIFSEQFYEGLEALQRRGPARRRRRFLPGRVLAVAATVLLLLGVLTAGAFWEQLNLFFTQVHDTYTKLYVTPRAPEDTASDVGIPSDWTNYWYPQDMPEGYVFSDAYNADGAIKAIVFSNGSSQVITLLQCDASTPLFNDNEATEAEGIYVNGFSAYAVEKEVAGTELRVLSWSQGGSNLYLQGGCAFDELLEIAESMRLIQKEDN